MNVEIPEPDENSVVVVMSYNKWANGGEVVFDYLGMNSTAILSYHGAPARGRVIQILKTEKTLTLEDLAARVEKLERRA